jgi:alpha-methylacyl-CoA racemase
MVEGVAAMTTMIHAMQAIGRWSDPPGSNLLDSGAHFYEVYETADGGHVAIGAIEPQFYAELLRVLELDPEDFPQMDESRWPELKDRFADVFRRRTRAEWAEILEPLDACATAIYGLGEAAEHPHNQARDTFIEIGGKRQPAPVPRFSRTSPGVPAPPPRRGAAPEEALAGWGLSGDEIAELREAGGIR